MALDAKLYVWNVGGSDNVQVGTPLFFPGDLYRVRVGKFVICSTKFSPNAKNVLRFQCQKQQFSPCAETGRGVKEREKRQGKKEANGVER